MFVLISIGVTVGLLLAMLLTMLLTPRVVEYVETVEINGSPKQIYDAIRHQSQLMQWSAWPSETGSSCQVAGEDGVIGAQTVFFDKKGRRFGHQTVEALTAPSFVEFSLESKGPPHTPILAFHVVPNLAEAGADHCTVVLHFRNAIMPPFHVLLRLLGVVRWTREMHLKDLDGLKRYVEKSEDYLGQMLAKAA
ncbi:MAG: SRPBCC family protein [Pseudomonadota bacterium]